MVLELEILGQPRDRRDSRRHGPLAFQPGRYTVIGKLGLVAHPGAGIIGKRQNLSGEQLRNRAITDMFEPAILLIVGLVSEDGSLDRNGLTDYMVSNVQDIVSRLDGVGELLLFGTQNAMRIWVNPAKLNNFHLTTNDVITALQALGLVKQS